MMIQNIDAERAVLAALMTDYARMKPVLDELTEEYFSDPMTLETFRAVKASVDAGLVPDRPTVYEHMPITVKQNHGGKYLSELYHTGATLDTPENTVAILKKNKLKRDYAKVLEAGIQGIADNRDPAEVIDDVLLKAKGLEDRAAQVVELEENWTEVLKDIDRISKGEKLGLLTGFWDLDQELGGIHQEDLVVVAGRPGTGKSQLTFQFATNNARLFNKNSLIFALEMSAKQMFIRWLANETLVEKRRIRRAKMTDEEVRRVFDVIGKKRGKVLIDDSANSRIEHIVRQSKVVAAKTKLDMIIVDHLQLVSSDERNTGRTVELDEITRRLKLLAKDIKVPVFITSQLSRKCEDRTNKRPMLSDLRESGGIEQNADLVISIYHDTMYHPDSDKKNIAEVSILKNREEGVGTIEMLFRPEIVKFACLERHHEHI